MCDPHLKGHKFARLTSPLWGGGLLHHTLVYGAVASHFSVWGHASCVCLTCHSTCGVLKTVMACLCRLELAPMSLQSWFHVLLPSCRYASAETHVCGNGCRSPIVRCCAGSGMCDCQGTSRCDCVRPCEALPVYAAHGASLIAMGC